MKHISNITEELIYSNNPYDIRIAYTVKTEYPLIEDISLADGIAIRKWYNTMVSNGFIV